jgi:hypothetical protein
MAVSAHSLFVLSVRWKWLLFVLFVLHSNVIVSLEVILMTMALERKKLTINEEVKIIQEVEKNPTVSQNEIAKMFCAASDIN